MKWKLIHKEYAGITLFGSRLLGSGAVREGKKILFVGYFEWEEGAP